MLTHFTGVGVSTSTARRLTEGAGAAYLAVHALDLERLERELPRRATRPRLPASECRWRVRPAGRWNLG